MMFRRVLVAAALLFGCCISMAVASSGCDPALIDTNALGIRDACSRALDSGLRDQSKFEALKTRGRAHRVLRQYDASIKDFREAIKLNPNDAYVHERLGWTAYDSGNHELAFSEAKLAIMLDPTFAAGHDLLGVIASTADFGDYKLASKAHDESVRLQPNNLYFRTNRIELLKNSGQTEEAVRALDAIERDFSSAELNKPNSQTYDGKNINTQTMIYLHRGLMFTWLGRLGEAREQYDRAVSNEGSALTYGWRAEFGFTNRGSDDDVTRDLSKALADDPNFWLARSIQGRRNFNAKNYERALEDFSVASKGYEINGALHWWRARILRILGRPDEATQAALTAVLVDRGVLGEKLAVLQKRGYLGQITPGTDPLPIIKDAMTACMLDKDCG